MSLGDQLALLREMLEAAESSLRSAKHIITELTGGTGNASKAVITRQAAGLKQSDDKGQIIEGVFDGQNMMGPEGKSYPVPANYASKSKLIAGDVLKLTISDDGSFIYKQIGPIDRKRVIGPLIFENGQYKILAGGKAYKVLLASVTYYHAEVGDNVTLIVPTTDDSEWGAIDNVLPKFS